MASPRVRAPVGEAGPRLAPRGPGGRHTLPRDATPTGLRRGFPAPFWGSSPPLAAPKPASDAGFWYIRRSLLEARARCTSPSPALLAFLGFFLRGSRTTARHPVPMETEQAFASRVSRRARRTYRLGARRRGFDVYGHLQAARERLGNASLLALTRAWPQSR